ncbi:LPXTG cell wall anchor domain-containing protein [Corynebacterium auriscanis]|nr:LPXTG cell wall anchor domain-containing protein [Corynebacterium auriscanis]
MLPITGASIAIAMLAGLALVFSGGVVMFRRKTRNPANNHRRTG